MATEKKTKVDTWIFNLLVIIAGVGIIGYLLGSGIASVEGVISNLGGIFLNLTVYLLVIYGIEFFQRGLGKNIRDEIYDQDNTAAALYELGIKLGIALVIAKGLI